MTRARCSSSRGESARSTGASSPRCSRAGPSSRRPTASPRSSRRLSCRTCCAAPTTTATRCSPSIRARAVRIQDWAEMLMRMYTRWAERHGFPVGPRPAARRGSRHQVRGDPDQRAIRVRVLKAEKAFTAWCAISPFDAQSRRHTSFASVFVYRCGRGSKSTSRRRPADRRVPCSGKGGSTSTRRVGGPDHPPPDQHRGAVPERAQPFKNKATALKMLKARLYERAVAERERKGGSGQAEERHRLRQSDRSYVFQPTPW